MGCDIHMIAQVRDKYDHKWKNLPNKVYDWRSYNTFAILADVRNGRGFAGIKTGEGYQPISQPKGLPEEIDLADEGESAKLYEYEWYKDEPGKFITRWLGDHSHSYLTLKELEDYWKEHANSKTYLTGVIPYDVFKKLDGTDKGPESWSGGISGPDIIVISESEARTHAGAFKKGKQYYVQYTWGVTYDESTSIGMIIRALRSIKETQEAETDEDVRIVFGFDS